MRLDGGPRCHGGVVLACGSAAVGMLALLGLSAAVAADAGSVDFARDVRPILGDKCFACHGPDDKARQASLRLDTRAGALAPAASGRPPVVPGRPQASSLVARVLARGPLQMPPPSTGKKITLAEAEILKRWIAQGAPYAEHWAFVPPRRPRIPTIGEGRFMHSRRQDAQVAAKHKDAGAVPRRTPIHQPSASNSPNARLWSTWPRNPVDNFALDRMLRAGLRPNPPADRHTLARRVSLDLIGLPPSPTEVDRFVRDPSPDAYERMVDRLLASPHFGERWARPWLDLARYADSAGYGSDPLRPNLWPWRDWVIRALNADMPFDQFTVEQIAGDLLPNPTPEQLIATAFHRNTMTNTEGGTDDEEFRVAAVKDRAITTAQVWMGLTLQCAQCHNHKYDPLSQKEFYRFAAFFNQTEDNDQPDERPTFPLLAPQEEARRGAIQREINRLEALAAGSADAKTALEAKRKELEAIKPVEVPIMRELPPGKRRETHVLTLGNFLQKGEKVQPGVPAAFHPLPQGGEPNRLALARWLVSTGNPLTARVVVNRIWAQVFGTGIVETEEDFGHQGALPSHPELLDWLAVEFMRPTVGATRFAGGLQRNADGAGGPLRNQSWAAGPPRPWSVKHVIRLIVTSATYRQSSRVTPGHLARDPRNRLLARYPRRRLDAETVRDQALALSGLLSRKIGGPSVYPPQPEGLWQAAFNGERTWPTSKGEDRYRRGLYTFWRRTVPYPSMATFDAPSRETCTVRRIHTNTPLQALVTLNDPAYLEMAQALARRIVREGGNSTEQRAAYALRLALCRPAGPAQVRQIVALVQHELDHYRAKPDAALKLATDPLGPLPAGADAAEMAAWTAAANVVLNLDAVLTRG